MAGGWTRDGAANEEIAAQVADELRRLQARRRPVGESLTHCAECDEPIPEARRRAIPGVKLCIDCQAERDATPVSRAAFDRRAPKGSQMK
jgi:phage/conjugal plasmid C-4 type zinc finger TraR family protein